MFRSLSPRSAAAPGACLLGALALLVGVASPATAEPIGAGEASAFGGTITVGGEEVIPPTPVAEASLGEEASETTIDIPADPLAVSGTLNADAVVTAESTLESSLVAVEQEVAGPYNAKGVGSVEEAEVLVKQLEGEVSLLTADVIRGEAVAVCTGGQVQYSANSEIVNLQIGGEPVPLNEPLEQIIDGLNQVLAETTLNQLVNIERNVVTKTADGAAVDALVVTLLAAAGEAPLAQVRLGHAEVNGVSCGAATECNDGVDNLDPEDELADIDDPGCHTDGDPTNAASFDPTDDDETDAATPAASPSAPSQLPVTGGDAASTAGLALAMAAGALAVVGLRRRLV